MNNYIDSDGFLAFLAKLAICITLTAGLIGGDILRKKQVQELEQRVQKLQEKIEELQSEGSPSGRWQLP